MTSVQASSAGVTDSLSTKYSKQVSLADCENQANPSKMPSVSASYNQSLASHKPGELIGASTNEEAKCARAFGQDNTNTMGMVSNRPINALEAGEKDAPVKMISGKEDPIQKSYVNENRADETKTANSSRISMKANVSNIVMAVNSHNSKAVNSFNESNRDSLV